MSFFAKCLARLRKRKGLLIVILAVLLLEALSGAQYFFTHRLLEDELEKRAEDELTTKAILIKGVLNEAEHTMISHFWDISNSLSHPDSVRHAVERVVLYNNNVKGAGVSFVPNYYPSEGRLVEYYSTRISQDDREVVTRQIADEVRHNYTKSAVWHESMAADGDFIWVDPYVDNEGAGGLVTTYASAMRDASDSIVGVVGLDVSLEWLEDTIDVRHIYPSSFVLLLTKDGKPILRPSDKRASVGTTNHIISLINDSTVARQLTDSERGTKIDFEADGRKGTVFYATMKGKPRWQLAVVCYDDEVFSSLSKFRLRLLLLMLGAFCILLFVVHLFVRSEKKLLKTTLTGERMSGELRIASGIQQALLPTMKEAKKESCVCAGRLIPAREVGGDLYNAFVRDEKLFFCIGDVSGKGVPAAIVMAITQTMFRNIAERENNPAHIMGQLNMAACRNNDTNYFITMFVGVLDLPSGHLRYCNAGHEVPILIDRSPSAASSVRLLEVDPNLPIGLFADFKYTMQVMDISPGSTLFLYTDGLTEARRNQAPAGQRGIRHELFGRERAMQVISAWCEKNAVATPLVSQELVECIVSEVRQFDNGEEQSDDLTLLAVTYTPPVEQHLLDETLTLRNDVSEVTLLNRFVKDVLARLGVVQPMAMKLRLALEEAVVNVMEYAYPAGTTGEVNVRVVCSAPQPYSSQQGGNRRDGDSAAQRHLLFIITDSGISFDPTEAATADTTLSVEERPVGGLGIFLVRELVDSINYERTGGKNILTLKKTITNQPQHEDDN